MQSVVAIHNSVNERAWREVMAWEAMHAGGVHREGMAGGKSRGTGGGKACLANDCCARVDAPHRATAQYLSLLGNAPPSPFSTEGNVLPLPPWPPSLPHTSLPCRWPPNPTGLPSAGRCHYCCPPPGWLPSHCWPLPNCPPPPSLPLPLWPPTAAAGECAAPRLKKFQGRPSDYSPKARLLNTLVGDRAERIGGQGQEGGWRPEGGGA